MGSRTILIGLLAIVAGVAAAIGARQLVRQWEPPAAEEMVSVVTMMSNVERWEIVGEEDMGVVNWPKNKVPEGAAVDMKEIAGRFALTALYKGQPVFENALAPPDTVAGLASLVPKGKRAFTILTPTIASGVAGFVLPGNKVDVLLTVSGSSQEAGGAVTVTLLQSVEILAVDQLLDAPAENRVKTNALKSVTLLVTPEQAAKLSLAQNKGTLELALRNPDDLTAAENVPVTVADLRLRGELPDAEALKKRAEEKARYEAEQQARYEKEKQEFRQSLQAELDTKLQALQDELANTKELLSKASVPPVAKRQAPPELTIRTLRGTHHGLVLVRPGEQSAVQVEADQGER